MDYTSQDNLDKINKLLSSATSSLVCRVGTDCYKEKNLEKKRNEYELAKENIRTAPQKLQEKEKNYYMALKGDDYNAYEDNKLKGDAQKNAIKIQKIFTDKVNDANTNLSILESLYKNTSYVNEVYNDYKSKNDKILKQLYNINDNKTMYQNNSKHS